MNITKKVLLGLAATATLFTSSVFADDYYYVTVGGGATKGLKYSSYDVGGGVTSKSKAPKMGGEFLVGAGYYLMDNVRVEALFLKPFPGEAKGAAYVNGNIVDNTSSKLKYEINSLQLRSYVDAFDLSDFGKMYFGAGLGWAQVKPKLSGPNAMSGKKTNNLTWLVAAGANFEVADGTKLGVEYNYQDFGKGKFKNGNYKPTFKGHALVAKLMFGI
jgi:opacity protein-like surface antigen